MATYRELRDEIERMSDEDLNRQVEIDGYDCIRTWNGVIYSWLDMLIMESGYAYCKNYPAGVDDRVGQI